MSSGSLELPSDRRSRRRTTLIVLASAGAALFIATRLMCFRAFFSYGIVVHPCPDGTPRQTVAVSCSDLRRGSPGTVFVRAEAHYTTDRSDEQRMAPVGRIRAELFLVDGAGAESALKPKEGWKDVDGNNAKAEIVLPDVRDGDYKLRAKVESPLGRSQFDLPLPIYAPARIHVITDRPLYQPGNVVLFRAVALRARDLAPLDGRPGEWQVLDPEGNVALEEKSPARDWGVAAGSFPLDGEAPSGDWRVRWSSGGASEESRFRVEPFTLPRFRVEASPLRPFYLPGEKPAVQGKVIYSSGAPVAGATLTIQWSNSGAWPPPTRWLTDELPRSATADRTGRFEIHLPLIPSDLLDQATLAAQISATDPAGDRVEGSTAVLLSHDAIQVSAVTELADGLVAGFNNRLYLRATSASGDILPRAGLKVRRAWDPTDKGIEVVTDEDGVAAMQIDPGPPVNVVIPPVPFRPPRRASPVSRTAAQNLIDGQQPSLADARAMDEWNRAIEPCARFVAAGAQTVISGVAVDGSGNLTSIVPHDSALAGCVVDAIKGHRMPAGRDRVYSATFQIAADPSRPSLQAEISGAPAVLDELNQAIEQAALDARTCLPDSGFSGDLQQLMLWQVHAGRRDVSVTWKADPAGGRLPDAAMTCIERRIGGLKLSEPAPGDGVGVARLHTEPSERELNERPQPTTMLGYELAVSASTDGRPVGSTKLRLRPGRIPDIRLRATPVFAAAGGTIDVDLIRGPAFVGELPEKLEMRTDREPIMAELDKKTHRAVFSIPKDLQGWVSVAWGGAQAIAYIRPRGELALRLEPERDRYAPGQTAKVEVLTSVAGTGAPAAVSLVGVDQSLGQLVPLPGPNDMAHLRPQPTMASSAFGALDAEALALGRIRGTNAAAATIVRVASLPPQAATDASVSASGSGLFDPVEDLTDHFYSVLSELHAQVQAWEEHAPKGEQMHPKKMADLWKSSLEACEKRKERVTDAYGRPLRLSQLPQDLLSLTDPQLVVIEGTRLPEDVDNWQVWVQKEKP